MLEKVVLGRTGLEVTKLGFGALEMRDVVGNGGRLPSEEHAGVVLNAVLDAGINFIDTAPGYGRSEEFIGRFISERRGEYYIATKCGRPPDRRAPVPVRVVTRGHPAFHRSEPQPAQDGLRRHPPASRAEG